LAELADHEGQREFEGGAGFEEEGHGLAGPGILA
jgi:hypothetical protein